MGGPLSKDLSVSTRLAAEMLLRPMRCEHSVCSPSPRQVKGLVPRSRASVLSRCGKSRTLIAGVDDPSDRGARPDRLGAPEEARMGVAGPEALLELVRQKQDLQGYRERHWIGGLSDYMEVVLSNPRVARNAYQRLHDMILSHGVTEYTRHHEKYLHYHLFDDPIDNGRDAVFGLDAPLMRLVNNIKYTAFV